MDWFATQCDQLRAMFGEFFASRVTDGIMSLARPALRLSSGCRAERSRLGGPPVLPDGAPWPMWGTRRLDFLGVIDFGELAGVLWLPELPGTGTAAFYYVTEMPRPWGDDPGQAGGWRVLADASVPAGAANHPEVRLGAAPFVSLPSPHEPALWPISADVDGFAEVYPQLYESWASFTWGGEPRHQAGGWPIVVQRTLWRDCALAASGRPLDPGDADDTGQPSVAPSAATPPADPTPVGTASTAAVASTAASVATHPVAGAAPVGTASTAATAATPPAAGPAPVETSSAAATGETNNGGTADRSANGRTDEHDWRLLLQLDSDDRLGWHWGETGFVYFSARAADVRTGALDRSWLILQATP